MRKKQREQVVELLRCAADRNDPLDTITGFGITRSHLGIGWGGVYSLTCRALVETVGGEGDDWRRDCLEAAQRVEDGEWEP